MFLRHTRRKKDGKEHRYSSIVENRRIGGGRVVQRAAPSNAGWLRELAVGQTRLGEVFQEMGDEKQARSSFRSAVKTMARAAKMSPENERWKIEYKELASLVL